MTDQQKEDAKHLRFCLQGFGKCIGDHKKGQKDQQEWSTTAEGLIMGGLMTALGALDWLIEDRLESEDQREKMI